MLDEATAAAEAMTLLQRVGKPKSNVFSSPTTAAADHRSRADAREAARHRGEGADLPPTPRAAERYFGVLLQYPGANGDVRDYRALDAKRCTRRAAMVVVAADLLALTLLTPPGEWGADVAVGNTQRFGVPVGFGGPHAAYMAVRDEFKRQHAGPAGRRDRRRAGQARASVSHCKRANSTSAARRRPRISARRRCCSRSWRACTRSITARTASSTIALRVNRVAVDSRGGRCSSSATSSATKRSSTRHDRERREHDGAASGARRARISTCVVSMQATSAYRWMKRPRATTSPSSSRCSREVAGKTATFDIDALDAAIAESLPAALRRTSDFLTHPVFNRHHSEHEMLRYLRSLADKDLALDRTMIPLGSCTMKLNATSEMMPVTWPEFAQIHPFAPAEQTVGYRDDDRSARTDAGRVHRLRGGVAAAERRLARRVRRLAGHPRVSRVARRRASQCLPDSGVRARHEPGVGADGRACRSSSWRAMRTATSISKT